MVRRVGVTLLIVLAAALGACGSDSQSECATEGAAEVCLTLSGGVSVTAQGLEAGSDLTVSLVGGPEQVVQADETGATGTVGFLTAVAPDAAAVEVTGTDDAGQPFQVTLSVG